MGCRAPAAAPPARGAAWRRSGRRMSWRCAAAACGPPDHGRCAAPAHQQPAARGAAARAPSGPARGGAFGRRAVEMRVHLGLAWVMHSSRCGARLMGSERAGVRGAWGSETGARWPSAQATSTRECPVLRRGAAGRLRAQGSRGRLQGRATGAQQGDKRRDARAHHGAAPPTRAIARCFVALRGGPPPAAPRDHAIAPCRCYGGLPAPTAPPTPDQLPSPPCWASPCSRVALPPGQPGRLQPVSSGGESCWRCREPQLPAERLRRCLIRQPRGRRAAPPAPRGARPHPGS
jgi:hypothetical protein